MLTVGAVLAAATAVVLLTGQAPAQARLTRVLPELVRHRYLPVPRAASGRRADGLLGSARGRGAAALLAGIGTSVLIGGGVGLLLAALAGAGAWFGLGRLEPSAQARAREQSTAMLPLATDLLAAALTAGCPPVNAVEQVGRALGGPLGHALVGAASAARFDSDPAHAWSVLVRDPVLRPLGRALTATTTRGTSPVPALQRTAHDAREAARWTAETRARALGARAAAPLGLCFLPAFILLGIVPVVVTSGLVLL